MRLIIAAGRNDKNKALIREKTAGKMDRGRKGAWTCYLMKKWIERFGSM